MTAGSWIYIGTQGILQGTYETFRGAANKYFNDTLAGTITVTAGLGGMGGAQPLAIKLAGGVSICIEVDQKRIQRRLETRYLDTATNSLDDAIRLAQAAKTERKALSIGLTGNAAEVLPNMVGSDLLPISSPTKPVLTIRCGDIFRSHTPTRTSMPCGRCSRKLHRIAYRAAMAQHVQAILEMQRRGAIAFDYGNNLRTQAKLAGVTDAFSYPGSVPAFIRDSFCEGRGPFRWVAFPAIPQTSRRPMRR